MLSLEDCRRLLNDQASSDDRITEIRDTMYAFAHLILEEYIREHSGRSE